MAADEVKEKKNGRWKLIIIILIVVILLLAVIFAYFAITGNKVSDIMSMFHKEQEFTMVLEDFVVNLTGEDNTTSKNYLKIQVALMYTDKKEETSLKDNISKIRDVIVEDLRNNTAVYLADTDNVNKVKENIRKHVNEALNQEVIKDVYFSDLLIQ